MKPSLKSIFRATPLAAIVAAALLGGMNSAHAQSIQVNFVFDPSDTGYNAATPNVITVTANTTYKIDVMVTATATSAQPPANFELQAISTRGISDISAGNGAFATGSGIGTVASSFTPGTGFITTGFTQPSATDLGSSTNGGTSVSSTTADGIIDFGGTLSAQKLTFGASPPVTGSGSSNVTSFTWDAGTFNFKIGAINSSGTTLFTPLLLASAQTPSNAAQYTTTGGSPVSGTVTASTAPLTFQTSGTVPTNDSTLNMTPATSTINVLAGGTSGVTNLSVANTASDASSSTGAFTGAAGSATGSVATANVGATITGSPVGTTAGNVAVTYNATSGTVGTSGTFSYTITNSSNSSDAQGTNANKTTAFTVNIGSQIADGDGTGGFVTANAASAVVAVGNGSGGGGSYAGLGSKVTSTTTLGTGARDGTENLNSNNPSNLGGSANILSGFNSSTTTAATVSMNWRAQTSAETVPGNNASSTLDSSLETLPGSRNSLPTTGLVSDIVTLGGLTSTGTGTVGQTLTDPFVLQMSYNPSLLPKGFRLTSAALAAEEAGLANNKLIYLLALNPNTSTWVLATSENTGNDATAAQKGVQVPFATFVTNTFGSGATPATLTATQLNTIMGAWGIDTTNHVVWTVLDHDSPFAVVPEPSAVVLTALGMVGLVFVGLRSRRQQQAMISARAGA